MGPNYTEFGEITQNNDQTQLIQSPSRSPLSVNRQPVCHFLCVSRLLTHILSCIVSKISRITGPIFSVEMRCLSLNPRIQDCKICPQETRNISLLYHSYGVKCISVPWTI